MNGSELLFIYCQQISNTITCKVERDRALVEIGEIKARAALRAQAYIDKLRCLSDLLLNWVQRMERRSVAVPDELRDVLRVANDALNSHGP